MLHLLYILLITITIPQLLTGMEPKPHRRSLTKSYSHKAKSDETLSLFKKRENGFAVKKKRHKSLSTNDLPAVLPSISELPEEPEAALIIAACTNNCEILNFLLENQFINPNVIRERKSGNT